MTGPIYVRSFGYRYKKPRGKGDVVYDCRGFWNPYHDRRLRQLDGRAPAVVKEVLTAPGCSAFIERAVQDALTARPGTVFWFGCTAGRHRSVAITDEVYRRLRLADVWVEKHHRELARRAH